MVKYIPKLLIIILVITSCKSKTKPTVQVKNKDTNNFFPVTDYIRGQLKELDSLPITPLKISRVDGKADSTWIKREDITSFAQPFISTVIDSASLNKYFSEKSFFDQTINAITFSYDPIKLLPDTIKIRRWDIYIDPEKNKVQRVYIVKQLNTSGQTQQLTWKSGISFKVTTITEKENTKPEIKEEEIIWNF